MKHYIDFIAEQLKTLTAIPSPSGYTKNATDYLMKLLQDMGYEPKLSRKGNVFVTIGGEGEPLVLAAHVDTLGAMVRSIKDNGRLRPTTLADMSGALPMVKTVPFIQEMARSTPVLS